MHARQLGLDPRASKEEVDAAALRALQRYGVETHGLPPDAGRERIEAADEAARQRRIRQYYGLSPDASEAQLQEAKRKEAREMAIHGFDLDVLGALLEWRMANPDGDAVAALEQMFPQVFHDGECVFPAFPADATEQELRKARDENLASLDAYRIRQ